MNSNAYNQRLRYVFTEIRDFVRTNYSQISGVNFNILRELDSNIHNHILLPNIVEDIIENETKEITKLLTFIKENIEEKKVNNQLMKKIIYLRTALSSFKNDNKVDKELINIIGDLFVSISENINPNHVLYKSLYMPCDLNNLLIEAHQLINRNNETTYHISEESIKEQYLNKLNKINYNNKELYIRLSYIYDDLYRENSYKNNMNLVTFKRGLASFYYLAYRDNTIADLKQDTSFINELTTQANINLNNETMLLKEENSKAELQIILNKLVLNRRLNCASDDYNPYDRRIATEAINLITKEKFIDGSNIKEEEITISNTLYIIQEINEEINNILNLKKDTLKNKFVQGLIKFLK